MTPEEKAKATDIIDRNAMKEIGFLPADVDGERWFDYIYDSMQEYAEWYFDHRRKFCPFCGNEITVYDLKEYKNDKP